MRATFFIFAYKMWRNTSSRLRFLSVMYELYTPVKKAARSLSCLHFATAREGVILCRACISSAFP